MCRYVSLVSINPSVENNDNITKEGEISNEEMRFIRVQEHLLKSCY